jgi:hypothetical protein
MKAQRVVVVVWAGGVAARDTVLDPKLRFAPRIARDLAREGTLLTRLWNEGWTNHGPSLQALATGRWEVDAYNDPSPARGRTLVEAARRQGRSSLVIGEPGPRPLLLTGGDASDLTQVVLSADTAPFAAEEPAAAIYKLRSFDRPIAAAFLAREPAWPDLSLLLFDDTDIAHQGRWSWYTSAIRQADELVFRLWERLSRDGRSDLLVLSAHGRADHGQTRWGFMGHGRDDEGSARLWLLALGPDFAPGRVLEQEARLIDVAPTIAHILGIEFPARGRVLRELFA